MLDLGSLHLADHLGFLSPFAVAALALVGLLVLSELAILLGVLIGNLSRERRKPHDGRMGVG